MPKVGMEPIRRQQLIEATLESVAELGLHATTINSISNRAGLSSGIISHYFGGKQGLIEASVRYLLTSLKTSLLSKVEPNSSAYTRLMFVVEANFSLIQQQNKTTKTWLSFWAQSMHDEQLHRLQVINSKRLFSNLTYSFLAFFDKDEAQKAAKLTAAMIDGLWLRAVLSKADEATFKEAELLAKQYISSLISSSGVQV
ncbi:transcriptional regulator BetI [Pseudoalteromonas sp. SMS1]|uniref:transcriptional regulator BetI n=1 Tax=Pseudoalteromonas sp. SMS1 TaxID=2908894 RepID=UPI001F1F9C70|nr:transcriptional regulator BetI [Pseudoalteromonas sp. SMS1]MCF2858240.1 transcriptional regulator BetI [Pseudoalteromonas sp. SMS1]